METPMAGIIIILALLFLVILGGLAGLVLFIVGLATKRKALWITGLVLGLAMMFVGMPGLGLAIALRPRAEPPSRIITIPGPTEEPWSPQDSPDQTP